MLDKNDIINIEEDDDGKNNCSDDMIIIAYMMLERKYKLIGIKMNIYIVKMALEFDEQGAVIETGPGVLKATYTSATWWCMQAAKLNQDFSKHALLCLERAEYYKAEEEKLKRQSQKLRSDSVQSRANEFINTTLSSSSSSSSTASNLASSSSSEGDVQIKSKKELNPEAAFSKEEKEVLMRSSTINGKLFLPWDDAKERLERFSFPTPFRDPDGLLKLSSLQITHAGSYRRFCDVSGYDESKLKMVDDGIPNPSSITQLLISDCSFVSSLCILATYERRWKKKLITRAIYPQKGDGEPVYNPSGKYMVKLWFNGVARKVIVDDLLPVDKEGKLICSYSKKKNELWVSILEKAYMKLNGGYDFPGSNSGIDLYALTGWIPENIQLGPPKQMPTNLPSQEPFNAEKIWGRLIGGFQYGDNLVTVATGELSEADEKQYGLAQKHAYAVLDVKEVGKQRLLLIKNPWGHQRWTGKYSPLDSNSWTKELKQALNYDPASAAKVDDGTFWIDYESLLMYFSGLYINWNMELFSHVSRFHHHFSAEIGPENDERNYGYNPQFELLVQPNKKEAFIWIVLSRHITGKTLIVDDESEYLTMHLFEANDVSSTIAPQNTLAFRRVYYPHHPVQRGSYSNNPHVLISLNCPPATEQVKKNGGHRYVVVASIFKRVKSLDFTISVHSSSSFTFKEIPLSLGEEKMVAGAWDKNSAGGNRSFPSFYLNPQWKLTLQRPSLLRFRLLGPAQVPLNVRVAKGNERLVVIKQEDEIMSSGDYRSGFCYADSSTLSSGIVQPGSYVIVPSTFEPGTFGNFHLHMESTVKESYKLEPIMPEGHDMIKNVIKDEWDTEKGTGMGGQTVGAFRRNPRFVISVSQAILSKLNLGNNGGVPIFSLIARVIPSESNVKYGLALFPESALNQIPNGAVMISPITSSEYGARVDSTELNVMERYFLIPFTHAPYTGTFELTIYTSVPIDLIKGL